jgi:hypothetical protein
LWQISFRDSRAAFADSSDFDTDALIFRAAAACQTRKLIVYVETGTNINNILNKN